MKALAGSRRAEDVESAAKALAGNAVGVALDLSDSETLRRQIKNIVDRHGGIDILVNNAGVLEPGNILEIESERLNRSLQVNFLAPLELIRQLAPGMKARGCGRIVNVSSGWGRSLRDFPGLLPTRSVRPR
jgi:NAD(P)-dependent dehydrogenase (short-subunit alcohol dehydrogenase family)